MQGSSSPLSIGVTLSATVTAEPGSSVTVPLKVYDSGTDALNVTGKVVYVTSAAKATPVPAGWHAQLTPATFSMQPGSSTTEMLTFRIPAGAIGQVHVLNYEFAAHAVGATGSVQIGGAVAGTLTVHTPQAAPPPAATPTAAIVVGFLSLAALLTVGFLLVRRIVRLWRRIAHSRAHHPAPAPEQAKEVQR